MEGESGGDVKETGVDRAFSVSGGRRGVRVRWCVSLVSHPKRSNQNVTPFIDPKRYFIKRKFLILIFIGTEMKENKWHACQSPRPGRDMKMTKER